MPRTKTPAQAVPDSIVVNGVTYVRDDIVTARVAKVSEASAHFEARDVPCNAAAPCAKTFRTVKGRDWHVANSH